MIVLHLLSTSTFSGAENVVCQIMNMYEDEKNIKMIYCSRKGQIESVLKKEKKEFVGLNNFSYFDLKRVIDLIKPDIIHAHDIKASILASFLSKECKIISHIHGNSAKMKKVSLKSLLFLLFSKRISHIFWVSESCLDEYIFKKLVIKKSTVLKNVISNKEILKKANIGIGESSDLIFVGRLTEIKNPLRLIDIFSIVVKKYSKAKLVIVGNGNLSDTVKEAIKKEKLDKNVKLVGFQSNPYAYMKCSKILILTSVFEGIPMCALEAMIIGLPVVATPTDGLVEIIEQGKNGFLSTSNDEIAKKIVELIQNDKDYKIMSQNAKIKSKKINNLENYKKELNRYYY